MAISVKIEYLSQGDAVLSNIQVPTTNNNISGTDDKLRIPSPGLKIHFLEDTFYDTIYLVEKNSYNGKVFDELSNATTNAINVAIKLVGSKIKHFSIYFDRIARQWATKIEVNGKLYSNDNYVFTVAGLADLSEVNIVLKEWNIPKQPPRVTSVILGLNEEYTTLYSVESNEIGNTPSEQIKYGIAVNDGQVVLQDVGGSLQNLYKMQVLKDGLPITILLNGNVVDKFTSKNVNYLVGSGRVSFKIVADMVASLQEKAFQGYVLPDNVIVPQPKTAFDVLNEIYKYDYIMNAETLAHLKAVTFQYLSVKADSCYNVIFKLLEATQCVMTTNKDGRLIVNYVG